MKIDRFFLHSLTARHRQVYFKVKMKANNQKFIKQNEIFKSQASNTSSRAHAHTLADIHFVHEKRWNRKKQHKNNSKNVILFLAADHLRREMSVRLQLKHFFRMFFTFPHFFGGECVWCALCVFVCMNIFLSLLLEKQQSPLKWAPLVVFLA